MSIKKTLEEIIEQEDAWINSTNSISELIDMLRKKEDKIIDSGKLTSFFTATFNRANYSYYYSFVVAKINELFPDRKTQVATLYTNKEHFLYMKAVLADALENSIYINKSFENIIKSIENREDATGISKLRIDSKEFLNGTLVANSNWQYSSSWDRLLDILAGKDVDASNAAGAVSAEQAIKERLSDSRAQAAGEASKSIDDFLADASEEQKQIFKDNLEQSLLMEIASWCANFREVLRWFELYKIETAGNSYIQEYKNLFKGGNKNLAKYNNFLSNYKSDSLPYGGRLCPITFTGGLPINNLKTHPFSWMFFRDIDDLSKVQSKLAFYKMIYRTDNKGVTSQYEVPLPITLPEVLDPNTKFEEANLPRTKCVDGAPFGDEKNVRLESINISFKGTTPTTAQNDVDVTITFHIPRISTLNKTFQGLIIDDGKTIFYDWKILDFITYYGNSDLRSEYDIGYLEDIKYSGINSRLIMKIGYQDEFMGSNQVLQDLLANSPLILDLSVIDHSIAKDPVKPEAKVTVKYAGFIMKMFNSPMTDVLAGDKIENRIERQKIINFAQDTGCDRKIVEELMTTSRAINKIEAENLKQNLINTLYERARIFATEFSPGVIRRNSSVIGDQISFGYDFAKRFIETTSDNQWDRVMTNVIQESSEQTGIFNELSAGGLKDKFVYWTTIGDIIDAAMNTIYTSHGAVKPDKPFDAPSEYKHPARKVRVTSVGTSDYHKDYYKLNPLKIITTEIGDINIADYPVSINFLRKWITTEIVDQGFDFYPLVGFIKQLIQACVTNFLNQGKSNMERPTIVAVDADLALPISPNILTRTLYKSEAAPLAGSLGIPTEATQNLRFFGQTQETKDMLQTFIKLNTTYWEQAWPKRLSVEVKSGEGFRKSQCRFDSVSKFMKDIIKNEKYEAACKIDEEKDRRAFYKYIEKGGLTGPVLTKRFDVPRQSYHNVIYCYSYPSKTGDYLPLLESESDCIANGIPVIRLPDFKYQKTAVIVPVTPVVKNKPANEVLEGKAANKTAQRAAKLRALEKNGKQSATTQTTSDGTGTVQYTYEMKPQGCQVVKSIKFTKKDDDYLREARYSSQHFGLFSQLTTVYSAAVELNVLCTFLTPGMFVYIDGDTGDTIFEPNSMAATLGLGGVHIITSVQHKTVFEENVLKGFTTTFDALYVYNGNQIKQPQTGDAQTLIQEEESKRKLCNSLFDKLIETETATGYEINQFEEILKNPDGTVSNNLETAKQSAAERDKIYYNKQNIKDVFLTLVKNKKPNIGQAEIIGDLLEGWSEDKARDNASLRMYKAQYSSIFEEEDGKIKETKLSEPVTFYITYTGTMEVPKEGG